jgi:hypothetical protein
MYAFVRQSRPEGPTYRGLVAPRPTTNRAALSHARREDYRGESEEARAANRRPAGSGEHHASVNRSQTKEPDEDNEGNEMTTKTKIGRGALTIGSVVVALGVALVTLLGTEAGAAAKSRKLAGTFDFRVGTSPGCTDPTCVVVKFRGVVRGPGEGPTTALFPAHPATNVIGEGNVVVHTPDGDLHLAATAVFNPDPASDGEITWLFEIVGGTNALTGASGYIMATDTADVPGVEATDARYTGKLVRP